jgi:hypothetical protein
MGVAALVLGIIAIILAFFGGVGGIILGIAAVVLGVLGRRAAERDGLPQGSATAGMVTGIIGIVMGAAIFAVCVKCASGCAEVARGIARLGEARATVEEIARLEMAYYESERVDPKGSLQPKTFASAGAVPAKVPCQERPVMLTPEDWKAAGWDKIHFAPSGPTMFQFEAIAKGEGKNARLDIIVRADPRCDGTLADLHQRMAIDEDGRPYLVQTGYGQPTGRYRRGIRRGGAPGPVPEPGVEPPGAADDDDRAPAPTGPGLRGAPTRGPGEPAAPPAPKAPGAAAPGAAAPGARAAPADPAPPPAAPTPPPAE